MGAESQPFLLSFALSGENQLVNSCAGELKADRFDLP